MCTEFRSVTSASGRVANEVGPSRAGPRRRVTAGRKRRVTNHVAWIMRAKRIVVSENGKLHEFVNQGNNLVQTEIASCLRCGPDFRDGVGNEWVFGTAVTHGAIPDEIRFIECHSCMLAVACGWQAVPQTLIAGVDQAAARVWA